MQWFAHLSVFIKLILSALITLALSASQVANQGGSWLTP
jgi:hypothetical protein